MRLLQATKVIKELDQLAYEERLRKLRLFSLGNLVSVYKYLMSGNNDKGARLFSVVLSDRKGGNVHKWRHTKIASEHKNTSFYCEGGQTLAQVAQRSGLQILHL